MSTGGLFFLEIVRVRNTFYDRRTCISQLRILVSFRTLLTDNPVTMKKNIVYNILSHHLYCQSCENPLIRFLIAKRNLSMKTTAQSSIAFLSSAISNYYNNIFFSWVCNTNFFIQQQIRYDYTFSCRYRKIVAANASLSK